MTSKKVVIDAANEEEIRIAIVNNDELEDYDFEVQNKEELKGNIYLAKVTRVESSLQAAFVEYGRDKQGFLPFNEISIDYFNIDESIKQKLKTEHIQARGKKRFNKDISQENNETSEASIDKGDSIGEVPLKDKGGKQNANKNQKKEQTSTTSQNHNNKANSKTIAATTSIVEKSDLTKSDLPLPTADSTNSEPKEVQNSATLDYIDENLNKYLENSSSDYVMNLTKKSILADKNSIQEQVSKDSVVSQEPTSDIPKADNKNEVVKSEIVNNIDDTNTNFEEDDLPEVNVNQCVEKEYLAHGTRFGYKIQDVIQKNQFILVQVVKDERGNKGASLTTYLSIPGRYCVFMPNSYTLGGGISKKIADSKERSRLKTILKSLELLEDSALIIRTAGINKTEEDIRQDYSYILNLWNNIQQQYKSNKQPALIYEEASIIKKILRDSYFDEFYVNNKNTYSQIVAFTKLISPELTSKIKLFEGRRESIFSHFNIEEQVKSIYSPIVLLKSGGYLVIHPTEALTAVDINSGKFKSNKNVEETALRNNLEAAKEIAKQLRLRNLGGLVVIDFIDMENSKNRALVERKLRDELKRDKAKIQVGQISNFGLLELARQHVKSSLFEKNFIICPKCRGMGYLKPLELNALQMLRDIKADVMSMNNISGKNYRITLPSAEAFYILNNKRYDLNSLEDHSDISIILECNDDLTYPFYNITEIQEDTKVSSNNTVLLLENEIASNLKAYKDKETSGNKRSNNPIKARSNNNRRRNTKSKNDSFGSNIHQHRHAKTNNKKTQSTQKSAGKSWIRKLFKI